MTTWATRYYRSRLTALEQTVYDQLLNEWNHLHPVCTLSVNITHGVNVLQVVRALMQDHPRLFWVNPYHVDVQARTFSTRLAVSFFFNNDEIHGLYRDVKHWEQTTLQRIPAGLSRRQTLWYLFNLLACRVPYGSGPMAYGQTVLGPMNAPEVPSVCEGVAKSMKLFCDALDIPCLVVRGHIRSPQGSMEPHSWNIVECDGRLYHMDITQEIPWARRHGSARGRCFLMSDGKMTRYQWEVSLVPACR